MFAHPLFSIGLPNLAVVDTHKTKMTSPHPDFADQYTCTSDFSLETLIAQIDLSNGLSQRAQRLNHPKHNDLINQNHE